MELVIFRSRKLKIDNSFKFKAAAKRLAPTKSVKHLGVLLDEHLHWNEQISQVKMKLNHATGILSKLKYNTNLENNLSFTIWLPSTSQVQNKGAKDSKDTDYFSNIAKLCPLQKITFKKCRDSATCIYKDIKILKFRDHITQQNCLFAFPL